MTIFSSLMEVVRSKPYSKEGLYSGYKYLCPLVNILEATYIDMIPN